MTIALKKRMGFRIACVLSAIAVVAVGLLAAPPTGLSVDGWRMLAIVTAALVLFISEAIPMTAICFSIVITMKYTGVATLSEIMKSSASSAVFFCMAGFGLAAALQNTNLVNVMLRSMYRISACDPRKMISVVCFVSAFLSIFTANGVAQVVVLSVVTGIIKAFGDPEPGTSRLAAGLMMAIYVGATTGGMFLPCSNGPNIVIMEMSEMLSGQSMSFFQWALFGVPCGVILLLVAAWRLPKYYQPEQLSEEQQKEVEALFDTIPNQLSKKDKQYLAIMLLMIALWFSSNWFKVLDIATIAMGGVVLMMLPGIELLSGKDFKRTFSPMNVVILLCIFPLASGMSATGAGEWLSWRIFAHSGSWKPLTLVVIATLTAFITHCLVPAGSANATLSATVLCPVLVSAGVPISAAIVLVGIQAGTGFLFPIEGTWQYTFGTEHYTFSDCIRGNWPITLVGMLCCMGLIPLLALLYSSVGLI